MEDIGVILLTYKRLEYAKTTISSFFENTKTEAKIHFHIADDESPDGYVDELQQLVYKYNPESITTSISHREGYGQNYNLATQTIHQLADYIFVLEDDWKLTREFPIDKYVKVLQDEEVVNSIRFGYIGYTQQLRGIFVPSHGEQFLLLDEYSPERHVFAGHPRLEKKQYQIDVGEWPINVDPGTTEHIVAGRVKARRGVLWPIDFVHPRGDLFVHIGSVQARQDQ